MIPPENKPPKPVRIQLGKFSKIHSNSKHAISIYFHCVGGTPLDSLVLLDRGFLYRHQFSESLPAARQKGHGFLDFSGEKNRKAATVSEKSPNPGLGGGFKDLWNAYPFI